MTVDEWKALQSRLVDAWEQSFRKRTEANHTPKHQ